MDRVKAAIRVADAFLVLLAEISAARELGEEVPEWLSAAEDAALVHGYEASVLVGEVNDLPSRQRV
jgi:hypothetical protein